MRERCSLRRQHLAHSLGMPSRSALRAMAFGLEHARDRAQAVAIATEPQDAITCLLLLLVRHELATFGTPSKRRRATCVAAALGLEPAASSQPCCDHAALELRE